MAQIRPAPLMRSCGLDRRNGIGKASGRLMLGRRPRGVGGLRGPSRVSSFVGARHRANVSSSRQRGGAREGGNGVQHQVGTLYGAESHGAQRAVVEAHGVAGKLPGTDGDRTQKIGPQWGGVSA